MMIGLERASLCLLVVRFYLRMRVMLMLRMGDVAGKDIAFKYCFREHNSGRRVF